MRGGPSKQPTPATSKGGPPAKTTQASNNTTQAPRTNDPRHIPR